MPASNRPNSKETTWSAYDRVSAVIASLLSGLISAYQNFIAILSMLGLGTNIRLLFENVISFLALLGSGVGAGCTALINYHMGFDLFKNFARRLFGKSKETTPAELSGKNKLKYWSGLSLIFVNVVLFGCAGFVLALTMGGSPVLIILAVVTGSLGAILNGIQELETWLAKFDKKNSDEEITASEPKQRKKSFLAKALGGLLAFLVAASVSAFLTTGLVGASIACGFGALPIFAAGILATIIGGGTVFMYYNQHLSKFFNKLESQWEKFKKASLTKKVSVFINAITTGASSYTGLLIFAALIAVPHVFIILAGVIGFVGSVALGIYFLPKSEKSKAAEELPEEAIDRVADEDAPSQATKKFNHRQINISPVQLQCHASLFAARQSLVNAIPHRQLSISPQTLAMR